MSKIVRVRPRYHRWHVDEGVNWVESNTGYAHLDWEIPLSQTALVLVDVWNQHYLKDTQARAEEIIHSRIRPLLASARKAGFPIIHAPSPPQAKAHPAWERLFGQQGEEREGGAGKGGASQGPDSGLRIWPPENFRSRQGDYARYALPDEPRDAEREAHRATLKMHPDIQPEGEEAVVATGDELHEYCSQQGILFLFFLGFNTNACILLRDYGTIEMAKRGYGVLILRDCTTGMESPQTHADLWQTRGAVLFLEMFGKYSLTSRS
jgi:nicotinamidase-related amidase